MLKMEALKLLKNDSQVLLSRITGEVRTGTASPTNLLDIPVVSLSEFGLRQDAQKAK
jgi:hypothetical protein